MEPDRSLGSDGDESRKVLAIDLNVPPTDISSDDDEGSDTMKNFDLNLPALATDERGKVSFSHADGPGPSNEDFRLLEAAMGLHILSQQQIPAAVQRALEPEAIYLYQNYRTREVIEAAGEYLDPPNYKADSDAHAEMTLPAPYSLAFKAIQDQNSKQAPETLIRWKASTTSKFHRSVPSLLDCSLQVLVRNAGAISSFDHVPERLKQRIANALCDSGKMDVRLLQLLLQGSPTEMHVKNCSWITDAQLIQTLDKLDMRNLSVLQLDLCGQLSFDDIMSRSLARSPNSLPCLGILSMTGARRLSDNTLIPLVMSAPLLQSINLSQCALLTSDGIRILADQLKDNLRELYIDECPSIDAMCLIPSIKKFKHLEVLSVAGIPTVCDEFVRRLTAACGGSLKELNLADCQWLTNASLEAIGKHCPHLCSLNISNVSNLTGFSIGYLANSCRSLQSLKIDCADFSDEAVAAFLETSGGSLNELSLNKVRKVSFNTALSLAKCSRKLISLDLSWCRKISNESLGLIVDSCFSLKQVKVFGCSQINEKFLYSHSNPQVQIVGLKQTPILQNVRMFEPVGLLLRHSPLEHPV